MTYLHPRCANHNPNAALDPDFKFIAAYQLEERFKILKTRLQNHGVPWNIIEQQTWEIQEYLGFCPIQPKHDGLNALAGSTVMLKPKTFDQDGFKIFMYPRTDRKISAVYHAIYNVLSKLPYVTRDPSEASLFIPGVDVSCWCESCLGSRDFNEMSSESIALSKSLENLNHWNGGRNHFLFEFSDAPCMPFAVGFASIASVGLSTFHHRKGLDVAMPLFAMVEFNESVRAIPISNRPVLLSFRGTRSPKSDHTRKHVWKLHNGKDVIVPCACRWFDSNRPDRGGYDKRCEIDEIEFQKQTYTHLMARSKFSLILEGFGYHSFRLTEVMAAGAIPVIAIDHYVLPFNTLLDWESFSIRVPEHQLLQLPEILRAIPMATIERMQKRVTQVFEYFFASLDLQVATAIEEVKLIHFVPATQQLEARWKLREQGLPYASAIRGPTPKYVQEASMICNAPGSAR